MAVKRDDDLERHVRELKAAAFQTHKPLQRWVGEVVVPLRPEQDPYAVIDTPEFGQSWTVAVKEHMTGVYAWLFMSYTVHGANAHDAEKKIAELFGVAKENVKIRTTRVEKIDQ